MIKKMMLLASMVMAAIALAAPAAAQAEANWIDPSGGTIGGEEAPSFLSLEGNFTTQIGFLETTSLLSLEAATWNGASMGEGVVTSKASGVGTVVGMPVFLDCTVDVTLLGNQWLLTLTTDSGVEGEGEEGEGEGSATTDSAVIDLENIAIEYHYNIGCRAGGTPATGSVSGTVTMTATNSPISNHVLLSVKKSHLVVTPSGAPVGLKTNPKPLTGKGVNVEQH